MEQIILIRIISIILYLFILSLFFIRLIKALIAGKISNWFEGLTNNQREKFKQKYKNNFKNSTLTADKKDNPRGYWLGIIINIIMIIFTLVIGYFVYLKIF